MPATIPFLTALTNNLQASRSRRRSLRPSSSISSLRSSFSASTSSSIRSLGRSSTSSNRSSFSLNFFDTTPAAPPPPLQPHPPRTSYSYDSHNSNYNSCYNRYHFHTYKLEIQEKREEEASAYEIASMEFENFHAARVEQDERIRPRTSSSSLRPGKGVKDLGGLGRRSDERRWERAEREMRGKELERERKWVQDVDEEKCVWWIGR